MLKNRVSKPWIIAFTLAVIGVAAGWFGPIQILLPEQAKMLQETAGGSKEELLSLMIVFGSLASMLCSPVWGAISDRLTTRWGRRRPIIVAGAALGIAGLLWLAVADSLVPVLLAWALVQIGLNGPFAALTAMIADGVPAEQRGVVGCILGVAQTGGLIVGSFLAVVSGNIALGYIAVAIAVAALLAAIVIVHRETPQAAAHKASPEIPLSRALRLGVNSKFVWAWLIRLLLNLVNALFLIYLLYYLEDGIGVQDAATWVLITSLIAVLLAAITGAVCGVISDKTGRRLPFATAACATLAVGCLILSATPPLPVVLASAALLGTGWGLYISVDVAILTATLTRADTNATMLGIGNIANTLPQVLAPVLAAPIVLYLGGYLTLYLVCVALCALSGMRLLNLRGVTRITDSAAVTPPAK